MKRILFVTALAVVCIAGATSQVIDKPAATVNYIKPEFISVQQLQQRVAQYQALKQQGLQGIPTDPMTVLDSMVDEVLLAQAAEKANITVTDSEVTAAINQRKAQVEQQEGVSLTDQAFQQLVLQQTGMTWDVYQADMKKQIEVQKYIRQAKASLFENAPQPTEQEIEDQYQKNATSFVNPEYIRFSQIFIDTRNLSSAEKQKAKQRADNILLMIKNGQGTFSDLVQKYSDDTKSRYATVPGDMGFFARNDPRERIYGSNFFDKLFALKVGQVSGVIESNIGYHIVKITDHRDPKLLTLTDPVGPGDTPQQTMTVHDYIKALLQQQILAKVLTQAKDELVTELKKKADIKIFTDNINQ